METASRQIATARGAEITAQQPFFHLGLFSEFVSFLDRGERTTKTYLANLRQFAAWYNMEQIAQPLRQDIISYRDWLTSEHEAIEYTRGGNGWKYRTDSNGNRIITACKPSTTRLYMQSVKQFFKWTAASGFYPDIAAQIHSPKVRNDIHKKDAFTPAEVLTIEQTITREAAQRQEEQAQQRKDTAGRIQRNTEQGKRLYAMYLLAVNCGLRTVELSRANIKDLETKSGQTWLYVWGKGHTEADARKPLAPQVAQALREYIDSRKDHPTGTSPLFVSTGNRSNGKRIASTTISKMLKGAMRAAGFDSERLTAHSLRHTAGTAVQELTGNIYTTQKYMRHTSPTTTEIYLHNETEKTEAGIATRLYALYHGQEEQKDNDFQSLLQRLTPAQLEKLTDYAASL